MVTFWIEGFGRFEGRTPADSRNICFVSPWSARVWASITRREGAPFYPELIPTKGEPFFPYPESVPGSLFNPLAGDSFTFLLEMPRELLLREFYLIHDLTFSSVHDTIPHSLEATMNQTLLDEIALLRSKVESRTITDEELRRAITLLREERLSAARRTATRRSAPRVSPDEALDAFLS